MDEDNEILHTSDVDVINKDNIIILLSQSIDKLEGVYCSLPLRDSMIKRLYEFLINKIFKSTEDSFCHEYSVNRDNLRKWLNGIRYFVNSYTKVLLFFKESLKVLKSNNFHSDSLLLPISEDIRPKKIINRISEKMENKYRKIKSSAKIIFWVDGDNAMPTLELVAAEPDYSNFHIFCSISRLSAGYLPKSISSDYVTIIPSETRHKDCSDHTLSMEAAHLDTILVKTIPFIIISADHFVFEVANRIQQHGRKSYIFDVRGSITRWLSSEKCPVKISFNSDIPKVVSAFKETTSSGEIFEKLFPLVAHKGEELFFRMNKSINYSIMNKSYLVDLDKFKNGLDDVTLQAIKNLLKKKNGVLTLAYIGRALHEYKPNHLTWKDILKKKYNSDLIGADLRIERDEYVLVLRAASNKSCSTDANNELDDTTEEIKEQVVDSSSEAVENIVEEVVDSNTETVESIVEQVVETSNEIMPNKLHHTIIEAIKSLLAKNKGVLPLSEIGRELRNYKPDKLTWRVILTDKGNCDLIEADLYKVKEKSIYILVSRSIKDSATLDNLMKCD